MNHSLPVNPILPANSLFFGDNGRCFCTRHAGQTALYTGRDLSGQRVALVTKAVVRACQKDGWTPSCERCGFTIEQRSS